MKILALIINLLGFPAILFSGFMIMMSPMMFDAPGSTESKSLWFLIGCFLLLPLLLIIAEFWGWKNFSNGNYLAAIFSYKWALLDVLVIVGVFLMKM